MTIGERGETWLEAVGFIAIVIVVILFLTFVYASFKVTTWAFDRFDGPFTGQAVRLRNNADGPAWWICADGSTEKPMNCLSRDEIIHLARKRWQK